MTRAGIVTFAGFPNAGKSTLLNRLVGEKLAITSSKAQSTRQRIVGIRTEDETQMVLLDTPGLLEPKDSLHSACGIPPRRRARRRRHRPRGGRHRALCAVPGSRRARLPRAAPVIVAINKIDLLDIERRAAASAKAPEPFSCRPAAERMSTFS
jgi:GTP-binding protein Era